MFEYLITNQLLTCLTFVAYPNMKKIIYCFLFMTVLGCKNNDENKDEPANNPPPPDSIGFSIINVYPHDTSSFTQGLVVYKGKLYEGTGEYGTSKLLKTDLKSGRIEKQIPLDSSFFGEGITILNDTVYQLTWKQGKVFVYNEKDLKKVKEFDFDKEGWGITNNGKNLIVSNGTNKLYFYNPSDFKLIKELEVLEAGTPAFNLNELEYIEGYIYANQWQLPYILKIDPSNGKVVGKCDLSEIWKRVKAKDPMSDVPNGIAYDSSIKKIYITGKNWPDLFEIQFSQ